MDRRTLLRTGIDLAGTGLEVGPLTTPIVTRDESRIAFAFRVCTGRLPKPEETSELTKLLTFAKGRVADGWLAARELATGDPAKTLSLPPGTNPAQAAAWTVAARVLLNLDETITKN